MKRKVPAWLSLMLISTSAGLLLGVTNAVTAPVIERQSLAAAEAGRSAVFPSAASFQPLTLAENATIDSCYEALQDGAVVGHVGTVTVKGYGGNIEVTIGLNPDSVITGISVGGDDFSESPGLGARTRDAAFTSQFVQAAAPVTLGSGIDAVTGATISSGAVVSGVNRIVKYIENLGKDASETDLYHNAVDASYTELPVDGTVEKAYRTPDGGFVVFTSASGFHGNVYVVVLTDASGVVTRVAIDETNFNETAGLGERILEEGFLKQFIGLSGIVGVTPGGYGAGDSDAVSSATTATEPETSPDAASSATTTAEPEASPDAASGATTTAEPGTSPDAASSATTTAEPETSPDAASGATTAVTEPAASPDAASGATTSAAEPGTSPDAASSASIVIEEIEGANAAIDGVSNATYSSHAVAQAVNAALAFVRSYLGMAA